MIVVRLKGGLGNQMFQYALGRSLSIKYKKTLCLDLSHYDSVNPGETVRKFELDVYPVHVSTDLPFWWKSVWKANFKRKLKWRHEMISKFLPIVKVVEEPFGCDIKVDVSRRAIFYFDGYWQSEKYFDDIANILRADFDFRISINVVDTPIFRSIKANNSVAVHVRRGDYISDSITNSVHGVCSEAYYRSAIHYLRSKLIDPVFYFFSDDLDWCRYTFDDSSDFQFVDAGSSGQPHLDLKMMSLCKHNVVANSSFSWWAAWLNCNSDKEVVAPLRWFLDERIGHKNIVPSSWKRL